MQIYDGIAPVFLSVPIRYIEHQDFVWMYFEPQVNNLKLSTKEKDIWSFPNLRLHQINT